MNRVRTMEFKTEYAGLQIYWEGQEYEEIEFLGPSVLSGSADTTAAICRVGRFTRSYLYPVSTTRSGKELEIVYKDNPLTWPEWQVVKGTLTIRFKDDSSIEPESITFGIEDTNEDELDKVEDWQYRPSTPQSTKTFEPRGKIKTTRLERSGQQLLRNQLVSERKACQITGTGCVSVLEACHIVPVKVNGPDVVENALLLRCDLHTLFDAGLLRFVRAGNAWKVHMDDRIVDEQYRTMHGMLLKGTTAGQNQFLEARGNLGG